MYVGIDIHKYLVPIASEHADISVIGFITCGPQVVIQGIPMASTRHEARRELFLCVLRYRTI